MGNHDYIAAIMLEKLSLEITEEIYVAHIDETLMEILTAWASDGGETTLKEFESLPKEERGYILEYLKEFVPYEKITVKGKNFILTHSGLPEPSTLKGLDNYDIAV